MTHSYLQVDDALRILPAHATFGAVLPSRMLLFDHQAPTGGVDADSHAGQPDGQLRPVGSAVLCGYTVRLLVNHLTVSSALRPSLQGIRDLRQDSRTSTIGRIRGILAGVRTVGR